LASGQEKLAEGEEKRWDYFIAQGIKAEGPVGQHAEIIRSR